MRRWDFATRNGIKFALAGTLSILPALVLRLDEPQWAVTTAFVLSMPKFVGAIGEKMVLRILGALAGAVIGCLLAREASLVHYREDLVDHPWRHSRSS